MELLKALYCIASPSGREQAMIGFLKKKLEQIPGVRYCVDMHGNIYAAKGRSQTYPCVVAHTDEVHHRGQDFEVLSYGGRFIFGYNARRRAFCGIGADDKNGIWIALKCLEEYDVLKCAFFTGEECGCFGSSKAYMPFFKDCRFIVQCDRRGNSDMIVNIGGTELCSKEFIRVTQHDKYGYRREIGALTDVAALKQRGLDVSCINLSCGYYSPHTPQEITDITDLHKCLRFVRHIIEDCTEVYPHTYTVPKRQTFANEYDWGLFAQERRSPTPKKKASASMTERHQVQYRKMLASMIKLVKEYPASDFSFFSFKLMSDFPSLQLSDIISAYNEVTGAPPSLYMPAAL